MTKEEVQELRHGLYRIYWSGGGVSFAAIGSLDSGARWAMPTNWTSCCKSSLKPVTGNYWRHVDRVEIVVTG